MAALLFATSLAYLLLDVGDVPCPEADSEPEPAVAPEDSDFLTLLVFLSLFLALVSLPEEPELAAAPRSLLVLDAVPELPDVAPGLDVFGGIEVDVPLPPAMPASLPVPAPEDPVAFCERTVDEGDVELLPAPVDCARASEETDAITTNDKVRSLVVRVIATSFN
ncbi:hypothetical protein [Noviherbaspirillum malthae]|uniref:hypothetical protein n=1 Tax=Noviherbaspirillum malthae TaxID=1260987 RepID=UPI0018906866|nr:hypothetical protein [Noviherbaspirillum malthae]